jgi:NAD(P)-dependent dehydrogenase (short-subunit alcohol dehydrogenase family)
MIILVTGATDGIGKQTALDLQKKGHEVLVHGRKTPSYAADFGSLDEVRKLAAEVLAKHPKLDVLVNNAGVFVHKRALTKDGFETTFQVNHLAPFLLTHLLLGALENGRIVNVSSMAHASGSLDWKNLQGETDYDGYDAYARSKLANVLFTIELARRLGANPTVNALHPGVVSTKLLKEGFGSRGPDSHEEGAATSVFLATSREAAGKTGGYWVRSRIATPSPAARDPQAQRRLYELSASMTGISPLPG